MDVHSFWFLKGFCRSLVFCLWTCEDKTLWSLFWLLEVEPWLAASLFVFWSLQAEPTFEGSRLPGGWLWSWPGRSWTRWTEPPAREGSHKILVNLFKQKTNRSDHSVKAVEGNSSNRRTKKSGGASNKCQRLQREYVRSIKSLSDTGAKTRSGWKLVDKHWSLC